MFPALWTKSKDLWQSRIKSRRWYLKPVRWLCAAYFNGCLFPFRDFLVFCTALSFLSNNVEILSLTVLCDMIESIRWMEQCMKMFDFVERKALIWEIRSAFYWSEMLGVSRPRKWVYLCSNVGVRLSIIDKRLLFDISNYGALWVVPGVTCPIRLPNPM